MKEHRAKKLTEKKKLAKERLAAILKSVEDGNLGTLTLLLDKENQAVKNSIDAYRMYLRPQGLIWVTQHLRHRRPEWKPAKPLEPEEKLIVKKLEKRLKTTSVGTVLVPA
jgi:hypothetical protein